MKSINEQECWNSDNSRLWLGIDNCNNYVIVESLDTDEWMIIDWDLSGMDIDEYVNEFEHGGIRQEDRNMPYDSLTIYTEDEIREEMNHLTSLA